MACATPCVRGIQPLTQAATVCLCARASMRKHLYVGISTIWSLQLHRHWYIAVHGCFTPPHGHRCADRRLRQCADSARAMFPPQADAHQTLHRLACICVSCVMLWPRTAAQRHALARRSYRARRCLPSFCVQHRDASGIQAHRCLVQPDRTEQMHPPRGTMPFPTRVALH